MAEQSGHRVVIVFHDATPSQQPEPAVGSIISPVRMWLDGERRIHTIGFDPSATSLLAIGTGGEYREVGPDVGWTVMRDNEPNVIWLLVIAANYPWQLILFSRSGFERPVVGLVFKPSP